eukprot:CAMPEP_0173373182 /NCGR_PEP_ID=MMETSP1144-20121109/28340_1 /TAXON_ID=483371 /ORGANISM="non described non described, Strain CCMP2298" /LENGTH=86 /DNA_ID=CAMNT_0014325297 /DNA_START=300 /DNA_END=560 /DNA_ORIENTATION=-
MQVPPAALMRAASVLRSGLTQLSMHTLTPRRTAPTPRHRLSDEEDKKEEEEEEEEEEEDEEEEAGGRKRGCRYGPGASHLFSVLEA